MVRFHTTFNFKTRYRNTLSKNQYTQQKGFFYLTGRDVKYRPVIVVNVPKIIEAGIKEKTFYELAGYFFQYVV